MLVCVGLHAKGKSDAKRKTLLVKMADTPAVPSDTPAVPSDTPAVPADTAAVPSDTVAVPSDTEAVPVAATPRRQRSASRVLRKEAEGEAIHLWRTAQGYVTRAKLTNTPGADGLGFLHDGSAKQLYDVPSRYLTHGTASSSIRRGRRASLDAHTSAVRFSAERFDEADVDDDKALSFDEFKALLRQGLDAAGVPRPPKSELREWFKALDLDHNGRISKAEFFLFAMTHASLSVGYGGGTLQTMLSHWDADGNHSLNRREFRCSAASHA